MPFLDSSFPVKAFLTDKASDIYARSGTIPIAFKIKGFSVGCGGYVDSNPVQTQDIDRSAQTLQHQVHPPTGYVPFQSIEEMGKVRVFNCRLPATPGQTTADHGLGEIGIWAEVLYSEDSNYNAGDVFLYAIGHMPLRAKTHKDVFLFRVVVNY